MSLRERDEQEAAALDELAAVREERREAAATLARIGLLTASDTDEERSSRLFVRRREIELQVAELRLSLWAGELRRAESAVRALGLRP